MKSFIYVLLSFVILFFIGQNSLSAEEQSVHKIRVLVFTGGHGFNADDFHALFSRYSQLDVTYAKLPEDRSLIAPGLEKKYDVLVMFDMYQKDLSDMEKKNTIDLLNCGIGLFAFHHHLCSNPHWEEYYDCIGGRTFLPYAYPKGEKPFWRGKKYEFSTFIDDQKLDIHVADKDHPITKGVNDFIITDEAYGKGWVDPKAHVLLTSNHPKQTREVAWTWHYGKSPVFALFLGHDKKAWDNPDFDKIFIQAIEWLATTNRDRNK